MFAVFGVAGGSAFRAEDGDAKVPDFVVDLAKGGFGEFVGRGEFLFELRHAFSARDPLISICQDLHTDPYSLRDLIESDSQRLSPLSQGKLDIR